MRRAVWISLAQEVGQCAEGLRLSLLLLPLTTPVRTFALPPQFLRRDDEMYLFCEPNLDGVIFWLPDGGGRPTTLEGDENKL